jgi:hypothetical protein
MNLSKEQVIAEAREIERFLRHKPSFFRRVCNGWDMRRKLEVDFAGGDQYSGGENIVVMSCGEENGEPMGLQGYRRRIVDAGGPGEAGATLEEQKPSIFGGPSALAERQVDGYLTPQGEVLSQDAAIDTVDDWLAVSFTMKSTAAVRITACCLDMTNLAVMASFEDPLVSGSPAVGTPVANSPSTGQAAGDIPGKRARLLVVGTNSGTVFAWNVRASEPSDEVHPLRMIQTESPEISCLALSALYLVHGGSDGLVQAWDPLASTLEPIRTLNARSSGRVPRHIMHAHPQLTQANYAAVGAIFLDPDPTMLRGVLAFGTFLRFWAYSSASQAPGRKRRLRHSDIHGRLATRRHGGAVSSYIAAEAAELRHEEEHRVREQARLRSRFGVGLGDLTEEEALRYAEMMSQESFLLDEQRRLSASDTGSTADFGETASSGGSLGGASNSSTGTVTPEPSISGLSPPSGPLEDRGIDEDDDYESQIQRAIRLSLMEGVNDAGQSPRGQSSGEYDFPIRVKEKRKGASSGKRSSPKLFSSPLSAPVDRTNTSTPMAARPGESSKPATSLSGLGLSGAGLDYDADLELALRLSLQEADGVSEAADTEPTAAQIRDEFPLLMGKGKGKGKEM